MQPVYLYTVYLTSSPGALERGVGLSKDALERVGDVDAGAHGAVEGPGEVSALVGDTSAFLGVLLVDPVARLVRGVRTVGEQQAGPVIPQVYIDLHACPGGLAETPLSARAPVAVVLGHRPRGSAHGGHLGDARLERPEAGHVDRDGEVH